MNYSFRPATEDDAAAISQLGRKIWHEHYPAIISHEQIEFMLGNRYSTGAIIKGMNRGEQYYLAFSENDAKPIALADIELKGDNYFLHKFYVDVAQHRAGIGTQFFSYIMARIDYHRFIRLQVNRLNFKAINFYFKMGFIIESTGDFDIGGGYYMNDFVMLKKR
jgi:ribosomal protein S18 acetylase RimI-like enzyme